MGVQNSDAHHCHVPEILQVVTDGAHPPVLVHVWVYNRGLQNLPVGVFCDVWGPLAFLSIAFLHGLERVLRMLRVRLSCPSWKSCLPHQLQYKHAKMSGLYFLRKLSLRVAQPSTHQALFTGCPSSCTFYSQRCDQRYGKLSCVTMKRLMQSSRFIHLGTVFHARRHFICSPFFV